MKKYLFSKLMEVSAWIGVAVILAAFFASRTVLVVLGLLLIVTDDAWLKGKVQKAAPAVQKAIDGFDK